MSGGRFAAFALAAIGLAPTAVGGYALAPTAVGGQALAPTAVGGYALAPTAVGGYALAPTAVGAYAITEELESTRPEAWAMRWFAAVTQPSGGELAHGLAAGAFELGVEAASIPTLDRRQRTVGFNGTKEEDLNRTPALVRLRGAVGLPAGFALDLAWTPPVEIDGATADLVALGVGRDLVTRERWRLAARLVAQRGRFEGDITCPQSEVDAGDDPIANPFGCERASEDVTALDSYGLELAFAASPWPARPVEFFVRGAIQRLDGEFRVHADYNGFRDRARLAYEGDDLSFAAGASWRPRDRWRIAGELLYTPLDVVRDPFGLAPSESDDLLHARLLATYRLR